MASELAFQAIKDLPDGAIVLDPMSGSGTVMKVAVESGHIARGFDVDPMAVLLSQVQTHHVDDKAMIETSENIIKEAQQTPLNKAILPWIDNPCSRSWSSPLINLELFSRL